MRAGITIQGLEALKERIDALGEAMTRAAEAGLVQGLNRAAREARETCPVSTGALRKSIEVNIRCEDGGVRGEISARVPYAAAVELGTAKKRAQPFLYPAYKANEKRTMEEIRTQIRRAMREGE